MPNLGYHFARAQGAAVRRLYAAALPALVRQKLTPSREVPFDVFSYSSEADLPRKLDPAASKSMNIEKISMDKATFDTMHAADRMASDKLKEGIEGFSKALEDLEKLLAKRLTEIGESAHA